MHIDGAEPVRIHNLPPFLLDGVRYVIGDELPVGVLREQLPANVLIAYLVSGRIRPANAAASRYPHGGMDANVAAFWALGSSPTDMAFNAPLAHRPAAVPPPADMPADMPADVSMVDDVEYEVVDTSEKLPVRVETVDVDLAEKRRPGRPRKNPVV